MSEISIERASRPQYAGVAALYQKCGYSRGIRDEDTILVAVRQKSLVGAVRLCLEQGVLVPRGMQILPEHQRKGIGTQLLQRCLPIIGDSACYCIPWTQLEQFYGAGGFKRCAPAGVPDFLEQRFAGYLAEGLDVILMQRI